ncbi:MAG: hypothetical protein JXM70_27760 [Pirellulales bacterium]|nr:hypothetical protein [Pirellulales bacterium]
MIGFLCSTVVAAAPIDIGSRLELMIDEHLIESMSGVSLKLHKPTPREVAIVFDAPWEGNMSGYHTVFQDGDRYRMYYKAEQLMLRPGELTSTHPLFTCYAESKDGIRWVKPRLGIHEFDGSKDNNIIHVGPAAHAFSPFKDSNPNCVPEAKYKAIACGKDRKLFAFQSPDGIHWSPLQDKPIMTQGEFDTLNAVFWDTTRGHYRAYLRDFPEGFRAIRTATSEDFVHWTEPVPLVYNDTPREQLYTPGILPYFRAPHIFIGLPARYIDRGWSASMEALPQPRHRHLRAGINPRYGTALTDALFMSSRDGRTFKRWKEAFIRPGPASKDNWTYGDNYPSWGILETRSDIPNAPNELSLYVSEAYWTGSSCRLRRFTIRTDGFVSATASSRGGSLTTKPLVYQGSQLVINFSTSAAGTIRIVVLDEKGGPLPGYDSGEIFGDSVARTVKWSNKKDCSALAGKPIRLKIFLHDADLFSFWFQ